MKRELWYSVVVRDRLGQIVSRERRKSKSFVRQWNDLIYILTTNINTNAKLIDGSTQVVYSTDPINLRMTAGSEDTQSIVVGSGSTPVTISDYQLETQIANGLGAGQLSHQAATVNASVVSAPNCGFIVERAFVNNSGGDITAREGAIYVGVRLGAGYNNAMVVRDVFGAPQLIPDGGSLIVNYTLRVTA